MISVFDNKIHSNKLLKKSSSAKFIHISVFTKLFYFQSFSAFVIYTTAIFMINFNFLRRIVTKFIIMRYLNWFTVK